MPDPFKLRGSDDTTKLRSTNDETLRGAGAAPVGQPVQFRTWGIPTASGSRARTGGWNSVAATVFISYLIRLLAKHMDG